MVKQMITAGLAAGLALVWALAPAGDFSGLAKQADKDLRTAQRRMFSGKTDEAQALLAKVMKDLAEMETLNPKAPKTASLKKKFSKLARDLEKRTGRALGGAPLATSAGNKKTFSRATPPKGENLPFYATKFITQADQVLKAVAPGLQSLESPGFTGSKPELARSIQKKVKKQLYDLDGVVYALKSKKLDSHPDLVRIRKGLARAMAGTGRILNLEAEKEKAQAQAKAGAAGKMEARAVELEKFLDAHARIFTRLNRRGYALSDLDAAGEALSLIETYEKEVRPGLAGAVQAFGSRYGNSAKAISARAKELGCQGRPGETWKALTSAMEGADQARAAMGIQALNRARREKERATTGSAHDFYRFKLALSVKEWAAMAHAFDPANPEIDRFCHGMDTWIAHDTRNLMKRVDQVKWPKTAKDAPQMSRSYMGAARAAVGKGVNTVKNKGTRALLGLVVTGPWRVFKTDILNKPVQYALPVTAAVQVETEASLGLARIYAMNLLTREGAGVEKAPPFIGATVGDSRYIRADAVR